MIYLALFAIIMTGSLAGTYSLLESAGRNQVKAMAQEEGNYLIGKIDWAMTGISAISSPGAGSSGTTLSVTKYDTSVGNPLVIALSGNDLTLSRAGAPAETLNNVNVAITDLTFTHVRGSGTGFVPESISASFTLNATTSEGFPFTQRFSTVKYVRK